MLKDILAMDRRVIVHVVRNGPDLGKSVSWEVESKRDLSRFKQGFSCMSTAPRTDICNFT